MNANRSCLSGLAGPLENILEKVEPEFLQLGRELQEVYSNTDSLAKLALSAARRVEGDSDEGYLKKIGVIAETSLNEIQEFRAKVKDSLHNIEESIKFLEELNSICPVIKKIARTLNIVAFNIAVESSRSRNAENMFSFFVNEIRALSAKVSEISHQLTEDSNASLERLIEIFDTVIKQGDQLGLISDAADRMVMDSVKSIEGMLSLSGQALEGTGELSKTISDHIGEIVMSIQFHDITRQQIEHIIEAIRDSEEDLSKDALDEDKNMGRAHSVLSLQVAQLRQVILEIGEARASILKSFGEIRKEVEALAEGTAKLSSSEETAKAKDRPFESLIEAFSNLNSILGQGHGLSKKIDEAMKSSSETASKLSSHINRIEEISSDLHIKAINAIIMSNRLGNEGRAHAVLAQDVTEVSKESNDFVTRVIGIIESVSSLADGLTSLMPDRGKDNQVEAGGEDIALSKSLELVSASYRKLKEDSLQVVERAGELEEVISDSESRLSFLEKIIDELTGCLNLFDERVRDLEPYKIEGTDFDEISHRYTMEIERDIHERVFDGGGDNSAVRSDKEDEDLGENVELF